MFSGNYTISVPELSLLHTWVLQLIYCPKRIVSPLVSPLAQHRGWYVPYPDERVNQVTSCRVPSPILWVKI